MASKEKSKKQKDLEKELEEKIEKKIKKDIEDEIEDKIEKAVKEKVSKTGTSAKSAKIFGEVFGYIIFLIFAFVIFPKLPFITDDYGKWLPIGFKLTSIGTFLKLVKHATDYNIAKRVLEIGNLLTSIYSTYWLVVIYPFNFAKVGWGQIDTIFPFALQIAIFAMILAIFVNFIRVFIPENTKQT
jgi:hypothetical protein